MITEKQLSISADKVLRQIEVASEKQFISIIAPHKGKILSQHVLEGGTLVGYLAILMGKELDKNSEIATIEIHREKAEFAEKI